MTVAEHEEGNEQLSIVPTPVPEFQVSI